MNKEISYYLKLAYPFVVRPLPEEDGGGYVVEFPDLPFCAGTGDNIDDAIRDAMAAKNAWIEVAYEDGDDIPEPSDSDIVIKMNQKLYEILNEKAKNEGKQIDNILEELLRKVV